MPESFVSSYSWLLAPGDHVAADYTTPTRITTWMLASSLPAASISSGSGKQQVYGQWIAQLLQNQLGLPLVTLYKSPPGSPTAWPITLSDEVIEAMDEYFERYMPEECQESSAP